MCVHLFGLEINCGYFCFSQESSVAVMKKKTVEPVDSTKTSTSEDVSPAPLINPLIKEAGPRAYLTNNIWFIIHSL